MRTNIDIDDALMAEAMEATGQKTKKATIEVALKAVIQSHRRRQAIENLWGMGWNGDLDKMREEWAVDDRKDGDAAA